MIRDRSITDEYASQLEADFLVAAERVRLASDWPTTQRLMNGGTYPLITARHRVDQGWSREQIDNEIAIRTGLGSHVARVIGNRKLDEEQG